MCRRRWSPNTSGLLIWSEIWCDVENSKSVRSSRDRRVSPGHRLKGASALHNFLASIFTAPSVTPWNDMSGNLRKNQVTRLVTLRHRSTMSGALIHAVAARRCHRRYPSFPPNLTNGKCRRSCGQSSTTLIPASLRSFALSLQSESSALYSASPSPLMYVTIHFRSERSKSRSALGTRTSISSSSAPMSIRWTRSGVHLFRTSQTKNRSPGPG